MSTETPAVPEFSDEHLTSITSVEELRDLVKNHTVFLDCYADWCPPCRRAMPVFTALSHAYRGKVKFVKANRDTARPVHDAVGVTKIPFFVAFPAPSAASSDELPTPLETMQNSQRAAIMALAEKHFGPPPHPEVIPPEWKETPAHTGDRLVVKRVTPDAVLPTRGSPLSAGYDLSACEDKTIPAKGRGVVSTGLSIALPAGTYGRVAPRSGLAVKKGIDVGAGVVDCDYRGVVGVVLFNFGDEPFEVAKGDRIAQLVVERIAMLDVEETSGDLPETQRGAGGFGSTGVKA